ncbi:hypothetical protein BUALT_Bualt19G0112100 [Buddleja alternifolia]|uniref:Diphthamide biosynthesis protein 3 n=1 Tax=Buddleja alternifolia TaxID=168488 RepID=A0AAV6W2R4_9LAMI|nr:hypothetical protein BUALT_Bualt19G0112100 [Buddleja alternifolia]
MAIYKNFHSPHINLFRNSSCLSSSTLAPSIPERGKERKKQNPRFFSETMSYDDVEIEDMEWNEELKAFTYPCPCGDLFQITKEELRIGEEIARCPSCSLYITVIYNMEDFQDNKSSKTIEPPKQQPVAVA